MPHPQRRSAKRTDNAFSAILNASRREVSTGAIESTFGDAFARTPNPASGLEVPQPLRTQFQERFGNTRTTRDLGPPGRTLGPESVGAGRRILPIGDAGIGAERIARELPSRLRPPGSGIQRPQSPNARGRLISGAARKRNARSTANTSRLFAARTRGSQSKAQETLRRRAFVKAGGQQAVDRSFAAAGGTKTFNARTGKRSVSIADPRGEGRERIEFGSIRVNTRSRGRSAPRRQDSRGARGVTRARLPTGFTTTDLLRSLRQNR